MSAVTSITLADGTKIGVAEWGHRPLYSTIDLGTGDPILDAVRRENYFRNLKRSLEEKRARQIQMAQQRRLDREDFKRTQRARSFR